MKKQIFYIILSITHIFHANILLQPPKHLSDAEIQKMVDEWETDFHWNFAKGYAGLLCSYEKQQASVMLHAGYLPIRSYNFAYLQTLKKVFSQRQAISSKYYFDEPLIETHLNPQKIDSSELLSIITHKKFAFYTGAGISATSNVATMSQLEESMHMQSGLLNFLKILMIQPQLLCSAFEQFCKSCVNANPTFAHKALHEIAQNKSCAIITENVDLLHQKAGSMPLHASCPELHAITPEDTKEIDVVICIGLSHDDRGLLRYFKRHNPAIKFVAIDIGNPNYLSESDYLVQEDLQCFIPKLSEMLQQ